MAYTAEVTSKSEVDGLINVVVKFTDGAKVIGDSFVISSIDDLKENVRARLEELNSAKDDAVKIVVGPLDLTRPEQSKEALDRFQFDADFQKYVKVAKAIELKLITGDEPEIAAFMQGVRASFKTEYADRLIN